MRRSATLLTAAALAVAAAAPAAAETLWIEAGLVVPVEGEPIPDGRIVIENGKVTAVGADVERPAFSRRIDARDHVVTPGFVVPVSRIGLPSSGGSGRSSARTEVTMAPKATGADEHFAPHRDYRLVLAEGVTALGLLPPGDDPGLLGTASLVSTHHVEGRDPVIEKEAALVIDVASHEPWREKVGDAFDAIVEKVEKERKKAEREKRLAEKRKKKGKKARPAGRGRPGSGKDDAPTKAVKGEIPVIVSPSTGAGLVAAMDELPLDAFDLVIVDAGEIHEMRDEIDELDARVVTWPALVRLRRTRIPVNRAAEYEAAEIPYAFRLDRDDVEGARRLRLAAIEMARTGASPESVLAALTLEAAKALGAEEAVGSIAKGRRADLLFWTEHPLDPLARLDRVMVAGEWVEDLPGAAR